MKYIVSARDWDRNLTFRFGDRDQQHHLTDAEVVLCIKVHGRAEIDKTSDPDVFTLHFHNEYD